MWGKGRSQNIGFTCPYPLAQWFSRCDPRPGASASPGQENSLENTCSQARPQTCWIKTSGHGVQGSVFKPSRSLNAVPTFEKPLLLSHQNFLWECYFVLLFNLASAEDSTVVFEGLTDKLPQFNICYKGYTRSQETWFLVWSHHWSILSPQR